jgi:hypothetical protein
MELLNRILAKTAVTNAQAIITDMTNRIEATKTRTTKS